MQTIRQILDKLPPAEMAKLNYAFEHGIGQFVKIIDGDGKSTNRFVGVNVQTIPNLRIETSVGNWSVGTILGEST